MTHTRTQKQRNGRASVAQAWVRAIEMTASIARQPDRIFPNVLDQRAAEFAGSPALLSERECLTYGTLAERSNRYARWALAQGIGQGETVGLFMPNRPEYLAVWAGVTKVGGVVALLNTNLVGLALAHCINVVEPKHLIVAAELADQVSTALPHLKVIPALWISGAASSPSLDRELEQHLGEPLSENERRPVTIEDRALYIYTSGTTGLPKAATVTHGRVMQWTHWFAGMMDTRPADRMYDCLPMYHSVGGVQATGAVLVGGGSVVLQEKFSARRFWSDIVRWDCTLVQYIGELCRYLIHTEPTPYEKDHRIRMACGNGLRPDVWDEFKNRFRIPQIFEFYAATEGNVSLFNIDGEPGAIGRIPSYLAHRFPAVLVRLDIEKGEPVRNEQGFCIRSAPNEVGEALGALRKDQSNIGSRFDGYTSREASEKKILYDVFEPGDAWFRTGDLMRKDDRGFFYFVDRVGDTFRWKGENVATSEVSMALCAFRGIKEANVYGVAVPGADGRAGMATLIAGSDLDLTALRAHLTNRLPSYACPMFLRIRSEMEVTATFKYTKSDLVREGYDPSASADPIYFNDPVREMFVRVDQVLYQRIQAGRISHRQRALNSEIIPVRNPNDLTAEKAAGVDGV